MLRSNLMKFVTSVLATVIGGIIVAWILHEPGRPDIKVVKNVAYGEEDGYSILEISLHNDGQVSAGDCIAYLEGRYEDGARTSTYPGSIGYFYAPAHGDAVYPDSDRTPIRFRLKRLDAPGGRMILFVHCNGYNKELTIEENVVPSS